MKDGIISILHRLLGYHLYLKIFSVFKITFLNTDRRKHSFIAFTKLPPQNANIVVIGACTGITTIPFARNFPQRTVFAYEPMPSSFRALQSVIRYYKLENIHTANVGLGDKPSELNMILPVSKGARKQGLAYIEGTTDLTGIPFKVNIERFDDRKELQQIHIDAIKIVAENFEYPIFLGAEKTIRSQRPLIYCELWDNDKREIVFNLIRSWDYHIYFTQGDELIPYSPEKYSGKNFIFKSLA